jgi:hypothetical protein
MRYTGPASVAVHVKGWHGNPTCEVGLFDPVSGNRLDFATATRGQKDTVALDPGGRKQAYVAVDVCTVQVSAGQ